MEFFSASLDVFEKVLSGNAPTQTPTQNIKSVYSVFSSQEMSSSLISFEMIFEALQFELLIFQ